MLLTTKGITPDSGGIGNQWFTDRAGIHARTLADAAKVLAAVKDPSTGYYDPRDPFTALKAVISLTVAIVLDRGTAINSCRDAAHQGS